MAHGKSFTKLLLPIVLAIMLATATPFAVPTPKTSNPLVISEESMNLTYEKLAGRLETILGSLSIDEQYWVAIAGGPGSGKTTTAEAVAERLNQLDSDESCAVVLPMDGFHYSQEKLKEMDPPDGTNYMKRRGAPWTMDAELCYELLSKAKTNKSGELPTYSREVSDPVEGGVKLSKTNKIVLVEGLYLLWGDDPRWGPLQELWDERWFVKCPSRENQRERLIQRSLKTWSEKKIEVWGKGREGAIAKVNANDGPNMDLVAPSETFADIIVESK